MKDILKNIKEGIVVMVLGLGGIALVALVFVVAAIIKFGIPIFLLVCAIKWWILNP